MSPSYSLLAVLLLGACAGPRQALVVKQFQLRDQDTRSTDEPMVKMEKGRRLLGAVSMEERRGKLGQYYTLLWNDPAGVGQGEVEVMLQYQQGATASRVKRMVRSFPASDSQGSAEFAIIGDDYFKGGKVLAWKATLRRGKREIASRQSYLWQ
ncbi:MAG: hypothetical protein V4819_21305 [Verrucomicrobiota bacterium]